MALARRERSDADHVPRDLLALLIGDRDHHAVLALAAAWMRNGPFEAHRRVSRGLRLGVVADVESKVMLTPRANVGALQKSRLAMRTCSRCAKRAWTNYAHQDPVAVPSFFSFSSSQPNSTCPRIREPAATVMEPAFTSPTMTPPSSTSTRLADSMLPCNSPPTTTMPARTCPG